MQTVYGLPSESKLSQTRRVCQALVKNLVNNLVELAQCTIAICDFWSLFLRSKLKKQEKIYKIFLNGVDFLSELLYYTISNAA